MLHILPEGFRKIRYGGIFSSNQKSDAIRIIMNCIKDELKKLIENMKTYFMILKKKLNVFVPDVTIQFWLTVMAEVESLYINAGLI